MEDVGPCGHGIGGGVSGCFHIDRLGEREGEAIRLGVHGEDLEGDLAGGADALEGEGLGAARGPAAVGAAGEEDALFLIELEGDDAGLEAFEEMEDGSLIEAVDLFKAHALDLRVGLLADVKLLVPWAEFPAGGIHLDAGGGLSHLGVGEDDGGRDEFRVLEALGQDARLALGLGRCGEVCEGVEFVAGGVALEGAGLEPFQGGGAVPGALVVGVEHIALGVHPDAARRADAGAGGDHFPVRSDAHRPAAPVGVCVE